MESVKQTLDRGIRNEVPAIEKYQCLINYILSKPVIIREEWLETDRMNTDFYNYCKCFLTFQIFFCT